jgi:hypothetical protein
VYSVIAYGTTYTACIYNYCTIASASLSTPSAGSLSTAQPNILLQLLLLLTLLLFTLIPAAARPAHSCACPLAAALRTPLYIASLALLKRPLCTLKSDCSNHLLPLTRAPTASTTSASLSSRSCLLRACGTVRGVWRAFLKAAAACFTAVLGPCVPLLLPLLLLLLLLNFAAARATAANLFQPLPELNGQLNCCCCRCRRMRARSLRTARACRAPAIAALPHFL